MISVPAPIPPDSNTEVYDITVVVADQGSPSRQTDVAVNFVYSFENLQQPQFDATQYSTSIPESSFNVSEGTPLLSSIGFLSATDADSPDSDLTFSLVTSGVENIFYIDPSLGKSS